MADFYQSSSISTLHRLSEQRFTQMESELAACSRHRRVGLVLPALIREFERPAMRKIVNDLSRTRYYSNIVVAVGQATRAQAEAAATWFRDFSSPVTVLWMEDPKLQALLHDLQRAGYSAPIEGKGRTCWLAMGYLLAEGRSEVIALHDCDIVNYSREIPAALAYPLAHPMLHFDFCKGYYARISGKLHGRVTRLFVAPLLEALREQLPASRFLAFLSEFRYPLAGEFALNSQLARKVRMPADWGLEVGVLSEVFAHAGPERVCQADIADNYEHKHQELSPQDSSKGLRRMTYEIAHALLHALQQHGDVLSEAMRAQMKQSFLRHAAVKLRQYEADARMNGLAYDRSEEMIAVQSFAASLQEAVSANNPRTSSLPNWGAIEAEAPQLWRRLGQCHFAPAATRRSLSGWLAAVPKPAVLAEAP